MKKAKICCRKQMRRLSYSEQYILKRSVLSFAVKLLVWTILKHFLSFLYALKFHHKSGKYSPSSFGTPILKYLFEAVAIICPVKKCVFFKLNT